MLSISDPLQGICLAELYIYLAAEDYYFNGGEPTGEWLGSGAQRLGLSGLVHPDPLRRLLAGFSPHDRESLVQKVRHQKRQCGWDMTFSAFKSFSVLWSLAPKRAQKELELAHRAAVSVALLYLEKVAGLTRRGRGGERQEPAHLIFAVFRHATSREGDPQIHSHALLLNACVRSDGTTGTVWSEEFFIHKMEAGAVYQKALAHEIEKRLGLKVEQGPDGFHIKGVPQDLCEQFSKRRSQIKAYLAARRQSGAVAAKRATLATRRKKRQWSRAELLEVWRQTAAAHGWTATHAEKLIQDGARELQKAQQEEKRNDATQSLQAEQTNSDRKSTAGRESEAANAPTATQAQQEEGQRETSEENGRSHRSKHQKQTSSSQKAKRRKRTTHRGKATKGESAQSGPKQDAPSPGATSDSNATRFKSGLHIGWIRPFPQAPGWSPASKWQLPRLTFRPAMQQRWGPVYWQRSLWRLQLRIQSKRVWETAGTWNPARLLTLPSFRLVWQPNSAGRVNRQQDEVPSGKKNDERQTFSQAASDQTSTFFGARVEWHSILWRSPRGSLERNWKLPRLVFGPRYVPPWGTIRWRTKLFGWEVRMQDKRLLQRARAWNPLRGATLPSFRFVSPAEQELDHHSSQKHAKTFRRSH